MRRTNNGVINTLGGKSLIPTIYVLVYTVYMVLNCMRFNLTFVRLSYVVFYAMSLWLIIKLIFQRSICRFLQALNFMTLLVVIYGVALMITGTAGWREETQPTDFLFTYLIPLVPLYVFYYFGVTGKLSSDWFSIIILLFFIGAFMEYYDAQNKALEKLMNAEEGFTNNSGYVWASLLSVVPFLGKKKIFQLGSIIVIMVFVILCFKRGAIMVSAFMLLFYFLHSYKHISSEGKLYLVLSTIIIGIVLFNFFKKTLADSLYLEARIEETLDGDSSNRDEIYGSMFKYFLSDENAINIFFGNGAFATRKIFGTEAHNDWLEFAINMGLLGLFSYLYYWKRLISNYSKAKLFLSEDIIIAMGMVLIFCFVRSIISMSFNNISFYISAVLGYTMAMADTAKTTLINKV